MKYAVLVWVMSGCSDYQVHKRAESEDGVLEDDGRVDTAAPDTGLTEPVPEPEPEDEVPPEEPPVDAPDEPVYLHTGETLYSWNPNTGILGIVGNFALADGTPVDVITDIAIDSIGRFYGVSYDTLYGINGYTAEVWPIAELETPLFGLTCTSDGRLVGGGDGLVEIDTLTGVMTTLVPEGRYQTSGDLVGLPDGLLYWAVREGDETAAAPGSLAGLGVDGRSGEDAPSSDARFTLLLVGESGGRISAMASRRAPVSARSAQTDLSAAELYAARRVI